MEETTVKAPILAYRGRLLPAGVNQTPELEHSALDVVADRTDREELGKLIAQGNLFFYRRSYRLALNEYEKAYRKVQSLGLPASDPLHMSARLLLGDALSALYRFPEAMAHFVAVSEQDVTAANSPITLSELWKKLAKVFMGAGDSFYKSAADNVAVRRDDIKAQYNLVLGDGLAPNPASPLYQNALTGMLNPVRRIVRAIDDESIDTADIDAEIVAIILDCRVRFDQVAQELNFLGHGTNYVPVVRFKHLQNVARSFASTAAQANREYLSYVTKIQDETFNLRQLEQAVEVNRSGVATHRAAEDAAREEFDATRSAVRLANTRRDQARAYANRFATEGYEVALLEEALAWAQSNGVHQDDQIKLRYNGLSHLGIAERYQPQSHLVQELTWARARRNFGLQLRRLNDQAQELARAADVARDQSNAAFLRAKTARLRRRASEERLRHSAENLESVRSREFGIEFFAEAAGLVRETASIYLQNAMLVAHGMELAYAFETGRDLDRIRLDYGDLDGAAGVFAADLLTRDIDAFTVDQITSAEAKTQPAIRRISLAAEYPLEFLVFRREGKMRFSTLLKDFQRLHPGLYEGRIKAVVVRPIGLIGANGAIGTLTGNGVSRARRRNNTVYEKMHAAETLLLSAFESRRDRAFLPIPEEQLDIFENFGLETDWELEIPQWRNDFDVSALMDVEIFLSFYGRFDAGLAQLDTAQIPAREISETRVSLLSDFGGDASYRLSRTERLNFEIVESLLPRMHNDAVIKELRLLAIGRAGDSVRLTLRFWSETTGSSADIFTSNAAGLVVIADDGNGSQHIDKPLTGRWHLELRANENPVLAAPAGGAAKLDLSGLADVFLVAVYEHDTPGFGDGAGGPGDGQVTPATEKEQ